MVRGFGKRSGRYRSGFEKSIAEALEAKGIPFEYERLSLQYEKPTRTSRYTPDFVLPNEVVIEAKGRFLAADRAKHLLIKQQHPRADIRFVFQRSASPISKGSKTTYADWCRKHGFRFADKTIPEDWLK